jgi:hypothetical protein
MLPTFRKQKADGRLKISWTSLKIQNLQLACKMDRPFILSNHKVRIPVDKDANIKNKVFRLNTMILLYIDIDIKGNALYKID